METQTLVRQEQGPLTESKRRIITLLYKNGPQTKRALTETGQMGWATVVKAINHSLEQNHAVHLFVLHTIEEGLYYRIWNNDFVLFIIVAITNDNGDISFTQIASTLR